MENLEKKQCLFCEKNEQEVPLLQIAFQDKHYWICTQHLPVLIHEPSKLEGKLPGAGNLNGA